MTKLTELQKRNRFSAEITIAFCILLLLLISTLTNIAQAQVLYGNLTGNVTDNSGAAVANAKVEALNVGTGVAQQTTSNSSGIYRFNALQPGVYKITIAAPGFNTSVNENVQVAVNAVQRVDAQLSVAGGEEKVIVTAEAPVLQTDKADVHTDISEKQIENLPITSSQGRNFQALYKIIPGAGLPMEANSAGGNPQRAISANVNGQSVQGNNTRIDGVQDAYPWLPQNVAYVPPADSIETVNVTTDAYDPEQGMAGGAAMNVQIKSGTNNFHGEAYEFHTDNALHAKDYFTPQTTTIGGVTTPFRKPKNIQNQFGGNVGGPIIKDKLFFFGDFERTLQRQLATQLATVPTAAERNGDFSALTTKIYDPNTGAANGTGRSQVSCNGVLNVICPNRIDPAAAKLMSLVPMPNLPGETNNYFASANAPFTRSAIDGKVNWLPTTKSTLFGRYSISWSHIFDPPSLGAAGGNATNNGQTGNADSRIQSIGLGGTYSFNPRLLADWNFGFTRQRLNAEASDIGTNFGLATLGIPGTNNAGIPGNGALYGGQPAFQFATSTYSNLGNPNTGNPFLFRDNQWVTNGNLSWIKGKHGFRFGLEFNRVGLNHFQPQGGAFQTARGSFRFGGNPTALSGGPTANQYNSLASFLFGLPSEVGKATQIVNPIAIRWSQWAFYARDAWQLTPKLTLTYGLRWEYYPGPTSDNGRGIRFLDVNTMNVIIGGVNGIPQDDGIDVGHGQFLPRVGVAYRLTEHTVIRAGYGMSADPNNFRYVRNWYPSVDNSDFTGIGGQQFAPAATLTGTQTFAPYAGLPVGIPAPSLPDISQGTVPLPDGRGTGTMANPFHRGYIHSYNLTVQQEFAGFVGQVGYVGSMEIHPLTNMNINPSPIGGGQDGRLLNAAFGHTSTNICATPTNPNAACRGWSDINSEMPFKSNNYNSLQSTLTRRFGGSQLGVAYTYSKALNYSDNEELNFLLFPYPAYWQKNYGLASFDRTHNFQFYGIYELPFGRSQRFLKNGIGNAIAGGWQFNWIFSHYSGTPFTITANNNAFNAPGNTETADVVGPIVINGCESSAKTASCTYFSPSSFAAPTGARFGTGGRDIVRGPGFTNLDASLFRNFKLTERFTFQFRAEAFGVTNTPHFANPANLNVSLANFGVITSTLGGNSGTNLNGARAIWFGGKLIF